MTTIVVGSVRSAGATTVALALAGWLDPVVLVEADPDGGVLALRYGLTREPGLLTLATSRDVDVDSLMEHTQRLAGGLRVVVAPESPERAAHLLQTAGARVAALLASPIGLDVVIDAGRLAPRSPSLCFASAASVVLVVARPRAEELIAAAERVSSLRAEGVDAGAVLIGAGPYSAADVTTQLGCPVIGSIAEDPRAARALAEGGRRQAFARSALARSARALVNVATDGRDASRPIGDVQSTERSEVSA